jgi:hypothetical protein
MRDWLAARRDYSPQWQEASFLSSTLTYLTSDELAALSEEIVEVFMRHAGRTEKRNRPEGALPVRLTAQGHPLPPTAAGN